MALTWLSCTILHLWVWGSPSMPYFIYRLFLLTLAMKDLAYYLSHFAFNFSDRFKVFEFYFTGFLNGIIFLKFLILKFNFSDRFREVFEFYFTGFLNGTELYNILKTFDFKIIPRSWCNFVFWYYPPGILKLFQGHGATLYSDTIHLGF